MLFAIVRSDGTIAKTIRVAKPFSLDGKDYSEKWHERMSAADKAALGITEVAYGSRADERYYWVSEQPVSIMDGKPTITFTAMPKDLDQLKAQEIAKAKAQANSELAQTDWMVIRKAERGVEIPGGVLADRAAVVAECAEKEAAIAAATTVEELIAALTPAPAAQEEITITTGGSATGV